MKRTFTQLFSLLLFSTIFTSALQAQDMTGIWRGHFVTVEGLQYKFELQVEQNKSNSISGVSYSYLSTVFYGKATLTGHFNRNTGNALIQEIKTVELKMSGGSVACIMKCKMEYVRSGKEEFLEGSFTSAFEKTDTLTGRMRGGDCGDGRVYLRKVITSDFYIEPFLRKKNPTTNTVPKTTPQTKTIIPPVKNPATKTTTDKNSTAKTNTTKPPVKPSKPVIKVPPRTKVDSVTTIDNNTESTSRKLSDKAVINIPTILKNRSNELVKTIPVHNEEIIVRLYDNGEIDDDTISVYMDRKLVLSKERLSARPLVVKLKMDEENPEHDLVMVAENLGRIPPNTSLMIVQDGDKRYEVRITSTEQKNAMVRFRYQKQ